MRANEFLNEFLDTDDNGGNSGRGHNFIPWKKAVKLLTQFVKPSHGTAKLQDTETLGIMWDTKFGKIMFHDETFADPYIYIGVYASPGISPVTERPMITAMMMGIDENSQLTELKKFILPMTEEGCQELIRKSYMSLRNEV